MIHSGVVSGPSAPVRRRLPSAAETSRRHRCGQERPASTLLSSVSASLRTSVVIVTPGGSGGASGGGVGISGSAAGRGGVAGSLDGGPGGRQGQTEC